MGRRIDLGEFDADVVFKKIKNVHLSVYPPDGKVRISAPSHMNLDTIRVYAISKLAWIKRQRKKLREQERETPREFIDRESHYVWGKRYLLTVVEEDAPPRVELGHRSMKLYVRPGTGDDARDAIVSQWLRDQIRAALPELLARWEPRLGVKVKKVFIQHMKTRWGSCNPKAGHVRLNTDLAKKPPECLEYILVHEMAHLIEPTHNERFVAIMEKFMPKWKFHRDQLNRLPVRHEEWGY
ncbi:MAG TPA: SprT family zinc-dependent metalloprotease [Spirochaetota bacterium]|nr:SprT family zinc-dependent metalloprotease [Spirochaetota bacterium]